MAVKTLIQQVGGKTGLSMKQAIQQLDQSCNDLVGWTPVGGKTVYEEFGNWTIMQVMTDADF